MSGLMPSTGTRPSTLTSATGSPRPRTGSATNNLRSSRSPATRFHRPCSTRTASSSDPSSATGTRLRVSSVPHSSLSTFDSGRRNPVSVSKKSSDFTSTLFPARSDALNSACSSPPFPRAPRLGEFTIEGEGVGDPERVRRYLMARWLRPAFSDSLCPLSSGAPVAGEGHGVLVVYAWVTPEHLEVSVHVEGVGERVPTATVDVPVELLPLLGGPDVGAMLARCEGQAEAGRLPEAWSCYGEVPETAAGREGVREGRERIGGRYAARVREALGAGDFETSTGIVGELSVFDPEAGLGAGVGGGGRAGARIGGTRGRDEACGGRGGSEAQEGGRGEAQG